MSEAVRSETRRQETRVAAPRLLDGVGGTAMSLRHHRITYPAIDVVAGRPNLAILREVERSGLNGRGGAGFPTATKMQAVVDQRKTPVVVINGAEGEPASDKDKTLMTLAPHLVLDGATIAAAAVGASEVVIAIGEDATRARQVMQYALNERVSAGESTTIRIVPVPDRFVAGEESALMHFLNDGDARPTVVPPRPFERGFHNRPTLVDNVETVSHVAQIANWGAEWFRGCGTADFPGTALVTVSGDVRRSGVYEVPLGTDLEAIVTNAGGDLSRCQAVLVGGYFGTWISAADAQTLSFDNGALSRVGASVGCGVIFVLPKTACGVRETARVMKWMAGESSGQCGMCVNGLASIAEMTGQMYFGRADGQAVSWLDRWANQIEGRGACRLPDGAIRFLRSALKVFAADIAAHRSGHLCGGTSGGAWLKIPQHGDTSR